MPKNAGQKIKLLMLYDILQRETDEEHPLSTEELVEKLREKGIEAAPRVLPRDISLLNEYGFEVLSYKKKSYYYYVAYRRFDTAELRVLIDAVQAANFIPEAHTEDLARRLAGLAGKHRAELLGRQMICFDTAKKNNMSIFYNIDGIERAIESGKKVSFRYFTLDYAKNKVYRRDGERYVVNPIVLICERDNYYLVCYDDWHEGTANYRLDRMDGLKIEEENIVERSEYKEFNPHTYRRQEFSMYVGALTEAEFVIDPSLSEEVFDKFGTGVTLHPDEEGNLHFRAKVQISPAFFRWIIGSLGKIRLQAPEEAVEKFREFVAKIKAEY